MYKELLFDHHARNKILKGVQIVEQAVASTLGPRGQNVIFEEASYPTITKDGVTVAQQIFLEDKFENLGVMIAREAAENTNRVAGDGTTTTIVLLKAIFEEGLKAVAAGMNPILLKRGMDEAMVKIIEELDKQTKEIKTDKEKEQIASISANNDKEMGKLIASVIKRVGVNGVVTVTNSNTLKTVVEYVDGTKIASGYESHVFINDNRKLTATADDPTIIVSTEDITLQSQLVPIFQNILQSGKKNIVLFASRIEGQALAFLIQNYLQGRFICVPVKIPSFGNYQEDLINDLAYSVNATVLGRNGAAKIEDGTIEHCGSCKQIIVGRYDTILSGTPGNIEGRIAQVKALLKESQDIFSKEKLKDRLGRLVGSIANIQVGGASEPEQTEIKYRIEDALNATKSAVEEGIVEGGGMALIKAANFSVNSEGKEFDAGVEIVRSSLVAPLKKIASNGGQSGEAVVGRVIDKNIGYNALTNCYEDLFKAGIIDPKRVVKNEIINAISTAGILLTSNTAIILKNKEKT